MTGKRSALTFLFLMVALATWGLNTRIILEAARLTESRAPVEIGEAILLSYRFTDTTSRQIHTVGASFAHDNFRRIHQFERNDQDVYVLLYEPPEDVKELTYRLVVDGIWTTDPRNPGTVQDRWGVALSQITVQRTTRPPLETPYIGSDGTVEFVFQAASGSRVSVVGSFNGWDPYLTPLTEYDPGWYRGTVRVRPGEHQYYFWVDGVRIADPRNPLRRWHSVGMTISALVVP